jgi:hypothetical protein
MPSALDARGTASAALLVLPDARAVCGRLPLAAVPGLRPLIPWPSCCRAGLFCIADLVAAYTHDCLLDAGGAEAGRDGCFFA